MSRKSTDDTYGKVENGRTDLNLEQTLRLMRDEPVRYPLRLSTQVLI